MGYYGVFAPTFLEFELILAVVIIRVDQAFGETFNRCQQQKTPRKAFSTSPSLVPENDSVEAI